MEVLLIESNTCREERSLLEKTERWSREMEAPSREIELMGREGGSDERRWPTWLRQEAHAIV